MKLVIGGLVVVWFLREEGIDLRYGHKFGIGGGVGTNIKGG